MEWMEWIHACALLSAIKCENAGGKSDGTKGGKQRAQLSLTSGNCRVFCSFKCVPPLSLSLFSFTLFSFTLSLSVLFVVCQQNQSILQHSCQIQNALSFIPLTVCQARLWHATPPHAFTPPQRPYCMAMGSIKCRHARAIVEKLSDMYNNVYQMPSPYSIHNVEAWLGLLYGCFLCMLRTTTTRGRGRRRRRGRMLLWMWVGSALLLAYLLGGWCSDFALVWGRDSRATAQITSGNAKKDAKTNRERKLQQEKTHSSLRIFTANTTKENSE